MITYSTPVLEDWVDYNGHLRDAYYLLIFSYATDAFMERIGLDSAGRAASGHSLFTLECHLNYLREVKLGIPVEVHSQVIGHDRKRVHLYHELRVQGQAELLAASEQMLLHVDLAGPRSAPFSDSSAQALAAISAEQAHLPRPEHVGRVIALP